MNNAPIGIYDSGLGGLTVWREVRRLLPEESLLYLGDGKNCPYGSRPREEVRALADAAVARLVEEGCKLVVVACNTATAAAIDFLRANYAALPIVGMEPADYTSWNMELSSAARAAFPEFVELARREIRLMRGEE